MIYCFNFNFNFHFGWFLLNKVYNVWAEKSTEELYFMTLESDAKFEEKRTGGLVRMT